MKQTLFLGVGTVLLAIGSFLASREHFYSAYGLFAAAIGMAAAAVWYTYHIEYRLKRGKEQLGRILVELSDCQHSAYTDSALHDYTVLVGKIEQIKREVGETARKYFDSSLEARFLAVRVDDIELNAAIKQYFVENRLDKFCAVYQQVKGWRAFLNDVLRELK
jgi:hypothetical protein